MPTTVANGTPDVNGFIQDQFLAQETLPLQAQFNELGWYSEDMVFLHQSTERLEVTGCTNVHGKHIKMKIKQAY